MSKRYILFTISFAILVLGIYTAYQRIRFYDGKLHVVFCDVGQGDGIFIRTPNGTDVVLDGGPDDKILACISNHTPFWDRKIELMMLSHPHEDHLRGLVSVLKRYTINRFVTEKLANKTASYRELLNQVGKQHEKVTNAYRGDVLKTPEGVRVSIEAPTSEFLHDTSPEGYIGENHEFSSLIVLLSYGSFRIVFTGDAQAEQLSRAVSQRVTVFQIPHHGSKTGITPEIIQTLRPSLAVISVGRNKYGHPSEVVLKILRDQDIKTLRTDQSGDIEIVTDGKTYRVINK